jgi:hypothetical protein
VQPISRIAFPEDDLVGRVALGDEPRGKRRELRILRGWPGR